MPIPNDLNSPRFDLPRQWMKRRRDKGVDWDVIATNPAGMPLPEFLESQVMINDWPEMDVSTWKALVMQLEEWEHRVLDLDIRRGQALVVDEASNNNVTLPTEESSCWQLYKKRLASNGFTEDAIGEIERATLKILRRLSVDTRTIDPVKGMVIGNVQSGKTANMAALMAMAADWGWNMFIVLSGTIENLRVQTQNRLYNDLNNEGCALFWLCLEHLSPSSPKGSKAQDLRFEDGARQRYFTVSLKNATRLAKLIQWLQKDRNKMAQMKILVIDDEADQAGINTADVTGDVRRAINRLITDLVNGRNEKSEDIEDQYMAMNYIGYTATPYANILNEASRASLYPKNFIATLSVPNIYFGPQQIFGIPDGPYQGLDIVRDVPREDLDIIKGIHKGEDQSMPESLERAICWFICCVAAMRLREYSKPISMLVHTSQNVLHHERVSELVESWVNNTDKDAIVEKCRSVWESETRNFPKGEFLEQYPDYGLAESVKDYPTFDEIEEGVKEVLSVSLSPIKLDESGDLKYHKGIHLCVDNSRNNGVTDEDEYLRLVYPDKENMPKPAPAFLVIGGATLSRGLTLEGLVCTFFLRSVRQADTLMQMGRWFGYRRGYELYPRIWLTATTVEQFEYLSIMDQELRDEIRMMEIRDLRPDRYAAKIRNTPRLQLIRITAKNRMQSVMDAEMDYSGSFNQTQMFKDDKEELEANLQLGKKFIEGLGAPREKKECNPHAMHACVWENVPNAKVTEFLRNMRFCRRLTLFSDIGPLLSWLEQMSADGKLKDWNVVLAGKKNTDGARMAEFSNCSVATVTRTRKNTPNEDREVINIGALRAPLDLVADVDLEGQPQEVRTLFTRPEERRMKELRMRAGLGDTPQLLLYIVDKDSRPREGSDSRRALEAPCDLLGVCVNIPGAGTGADHVARVSIRLDNTFADEGDLDGQNMEEE